MKTTLNELEKHNFHFSGGCKLMRCLGKTEIDDEPLDLLTILESNGLDDTLWCLRAVEGFEREKILLTIAFAKQVEHLMSEESKKAIDIAEKFFNGLATMEELAKARRAAGRSASDAYSAARNAADANAPAYAAAEAARKAYNAAAEASWGGTYNADAFEAADAAYAAAAEAAEAAAYADAKSEMQAKQTEILKKLLEETV
jgi:hypothetical protein